MPRKNGQAKKKYKKNDDDSEFEYESEYEDEDSDFDTDDDDEDEYDEDSKKHTYGGVEASRKPIARGGFKIVFPCIYSTGIDKFEYKQLAEIGAPTDFQKFVIMTFRTDKKGKYDIQRIHNELDLQYKFSIQPRKLSPTPYALKIYSNDVLLYTLYGIDDILAKLEELYVREAEARSVLSYNRVLDLTSPIDSGELTETIREIGKLNDNPSLQEILTAHASFLQTHLGLSFKILVQRIAYDKYFMSIPVSKILTPENLYQILHQLTAMGLVIEDMKIYNLGVLITGIKEKVPCFLDTDVKFIREIKRDANGKIDNEERIICEQFMAMMICLVHCERDSLSDDKKREILERFGLYNSSNPNDQDIPDRLLNICSSPSFQKMIMFYLILPVHRESMYTKSSNGNRYINPFFIVRYLMINYFDTLLPKVGGKRRKKTVSKRRCRITHRKRTRRMYR